MLFYSIDENGYLRKVNKIDFNENKAFLVDDVKKIYVWLGEKTSKKKKELSIKRAEFLKSKRKKSTTVEIINQNQEYGSFLAIMDIMRKGIIPTASIKRRPELKIKFEDTMDLLEAGLDPDFEAEITMTAHKLSHEKMSYEDLCHKLGELQMVFLKGEGKASKKEIEEKTEEIFKSSSTSDELCWLIAEIEKLK